MRDDDAADADDDNDNADADIADADCVTSVGEVLIPVRRYEGDVDISIITCIGRAPDDIYEPQTSRYHVIGLTDNIIIIMETSEIDPVIELLRLHTRVPLRNVTSAEEIILIKLELICDAFNRLQVLRFGITLTTSVVPDRLEAAGFNFYIMPDGGSYVWDAWRTTRDSNPNIVMCIKYHENYGRTEGGSGIATVLDHPLHISLFEGNYRNALPPHERSLANPPRLLPPQAITPGYPRTLSTVLNRTFGDITLLHTRRYRGGIRYVRAWRNRVEESSETEWLHTRM